MGTTKQEIGAWFDRGVRTGDTFMIVVCDTFDHEDYPVYVKKGEDVREKVKEYSGKEMQRVMEVYSLVLPKEDQLKEHRAFHFTHEKLEPKKPTPEEHLARHEMLHKNLDELVACYALSTKHSLRDTNLMELIEWSHKATKEHVCKGGP